MMLWLALTALAWGLVLAAVLADPTTFPAGNDEP